MTLIVNVKGKVENEILLFIETQNKHDFHIFRIIFTVVRTCHSQAKPEEVKAIHTKCRRTTHL